MNYDSLLNKPIYTFNIDIIERQKNIIKELREQLKGDDYVQPSTIRELEKNIYKDNSIFEGDTVYIRTGSNDDIVIDEHEFLRDSRLYEKISSDDMLGVPILDEPILTPTPTPDMDIIDELDSYINEIHNKVSPWHIFIILFVGYLITRLINIDLKLNVDI